ncbi:putative ribonuclease H-like domain-containing protein [Tanacetum coccineum]
MKTSYSKKGFLSAIYEGKTHQDLHTCLFVCFLSQEEPKRVSQALRDPTWVEAMQEELLQFKLQKVWILVDLPKGHRAIGTKLKRRFMYVNLRFEDPDHPDKVYKVVKALYGLHQAPRAWYDTLANYLLCNGFERGKIDQTLFIKRHKGHILLVQIYVDDIIFGSTKKELCDEFEKLMKDNQDKYVHEILRKFNYSDVKSASTPTDLEKPLVQDGDAAEVDEHLYRSMIGSLMYLTASRPDIMFAVCACARFQVSPKSSHLLAVKRIFRYLKGKPSLGLWLISWQCKKQTVVATSTTEAEYVAAASCCGQIDTEHNVADLLTNGFDAGRFQITMDIITNGDQATTDPASSSVPKTSLAANARRNNEKALNILLSAILNRLFLVFDVRAENALENLVRAFDVSLGRGTTDFRLVVSSYCPAKVPQDRSRIVGLLDDATISLKMTTFDCSSLLRSRLPPSLSALPPLLLLTIDSHISQKDILKLSRAPSVPTAPNCASHSDEIICSFFAQQAFMPTTHDDEDLLQIDEDAMEEIDIRWQVAMITA